MSCLYKHVYIAKVKDNKYALISVVDYSLFRGKKPQELSRDYQVSSPKIYCSYVSMIHLFSITIVN